MVGAGSFLEGVISVPERCSTFSIFSWNIFGHLPLKLLSPDFVSIISRHDIIILQETHLWPEEEAALAVPPGYVLFALSRPRKLQRQKQGGGVAVLISHDIVAKRSPISSPDILVLDFATFWLIGAYILLEHSRWDAWTDTDPALCLWESIALCSASGCSKPIIAVGDLNARTGSRSVASYHLARSSMDPTTTPRGCSLLKHCYYNHIMVLNGTDVECQSPGRYTSFQPNGQAVVDYALVSSTMLPYVDKLQVSLPSSNPSDDWADHTSLTLVVDRSLLQHKPRPALTPHVEAPMSGENTALDWLCEKTMASVTDSTSALQRLYGAVSHNTPEVQVYTDGSCYNNGKPNAAAGAGVFWGLQSMRNRSC